MRSGTTPPTAADAAVARWAAAAGVPASVVEGYESRAPAWLRLLRGLLLGLVAGAPVLALAWVARHGGGLTVLLVGAGLVVALRIVVHRRASAP
ncbi:hypothetical protein [Blastococcus sp. TF02-8]|uniref:hypothetical protein n=1 Tax=Blastococcus sp. TF02-8 TaxID=2250574 RepID=UPI000DEB1EEA|nr:hypothetical protein [Blastococcus sp. TF02-8]